MDTVYIAITHSSVSHIVIITHRYSLRIDLSAIVCLRVSVSSFVWAGDELQNIKMK